MCPRACDFLREPIEVRLISPRFKLSIVVERNSCGFNEKSFNLPTAKEQA